MTRKAATNDHIKTWNCIERSFQLYADEDHWYRSIVLWRFSWNGGAPKASILKEFSIINHPAIGVPPWLGKARYGIWGPNLGFKSDGYAPACPWDPQVPATAPCSPWWSRPEICNTDFEVLLLALGIILTLHNYGKSSCFIGKSCKSSMNVQFSMLYQITRRLSACNFCGKKHSQIEIEFSQHFVLIVFIKSIEKKNARPKWEESHPISHFWPYFLQVMVQSFPLPLPTGWPSCYLGAVFKIAASRPCAFRGVSTRSEVWIL